MSALGDYGQEAFVPTEKTDKPAGQKLERVTDLTSPLVVGQAYLVPTVHYIWLGAKAKAWPVLGGKHNDRDWLNFASEHYHIDDRFLSPTDYARASRWYGPVYGVERVIEGVPLSRRDLRSFDGVEPHPPIVWKRRICHRELRKPVHVPALSEKLTPHFVGHVCKHGKGGFICPHKGFALGTVPVVDGVITCPLHGLRIDAESGVVLPIPVRGDLTPSTAGTKPSGEVSPKPQVTA